MFQLRSSLFLLGFIYLSLGMQAQIALPRISPSSTIKQTIGLTDFEVEYSRPGKRGRELLGELIPYGRIWRVGANESTKFTVSGDVLVNGDTLKAGTYALYAFPEKEEWEVVFHADTSHWGDGRTAYDFSKDVLRVKSKVYFEENEVENFRIDFQGLNHDSGKMVWAWGNFRLACDITVFTDDFVMNDITRQIWMNPTADTYYQSARYLQEQGKDQEDALRYLDMAEIIGGPKYYVYRVRALVLAQLERYEEAIQAAEASKLLADEEDKDEFVRLNRRSIREWRRFLRN